MCLCTILPNEQTKRFINRMDVRVDGYVWLWKTFMVNDDETLSGSWRKHTYYEGKNTAEGSHIGDDYGISYPCGFHCFTRRKDAEFYGGWPEVVVPIKVRKSWITTVGSTCDLAAVVCKHIII